MGKAYSTHGWKKNTYKVLMERPERKGKKLLETFHKMLKSSSVTE
jgi:hypothetical protein